MFVKCSRQKIEQRFAFLPNICYYKYRKRRRLIMAQDKITSKQQEILEYIKETILKKEYPSDDWRNNRLHDSGE